MSPEKNGHSTYPEWILHSWRKWKERWTPRRWTVKSVRQLRRRRRVESLDNDWGRWFRGGRGEATTCWNSQETEWTCNTLLPSSDWDCAEYARDAATVAASFVSPGNDLKYISRYLAARYEMYPASRCIVLMSLRCLRPSQWENDWMLTEWSYWS